MPLTHHCWQQEGWHGNYQCLNYGYYCWDHSPWSQAVRWQTTNKIIGGHSSWHWEGLWLTPWSLVMYHQVMARQQTGNEPLPEPMLKNIHGITTPLRDEQNKKEQPYPQNIWQNKFCVRNIFMETVIAGTADNKTCYVVINCIHIITKFCTCQESTHTAICANFVVIASSEFGWI